MRTIIPGGQQDEAWRIARLGCATASNFGAVMTKGRGGEEALTRRDYRIRLALEILTGRPKDPMPPTRDMRIGIEREPDARAAFEVDSGLLVDEVSFVKLDGRMIGCSPDGLIGDNSGFEVKCPNESTHFEYLKLTHNPPSVYISQVQGCMYVTGRDSWYFASYSPNFPPELQLHYFMVERDNDYIQRLEDELFRFNFDVKKTVEEMRLMIEKRRIF